jgi:hypothetical protein
VKSRNEFSAAAEIAETKAPAPALLYRHNHHLQPALTKRQPTQGVGILLICDDLFIPRLRKLQDKGALPLHHPFHVSDQDFNRYLGAEEQLQQQFISFRGISGRPRLNGKPRRQMFLSFFLVSECLPYPVAAFIVSSPYASNPISYQIDTYDP